MYIDTYKNKYAIFRYNKHVSTYMVCKHEFERPYMFFGGHEKAKSIIKLPR